MHISQEQAIMFQGGRVIDPYCDRDEVADVIVVDGTIAAKAPANIKIINATGWIIAPGFLDMHVHLREPGQTDKETIETGSQAAAAGGFTAVACMPNTQPCMDTPDVITQVIVQGRAANHCAVYPIAAITENRAGRVLVDFRALKDAGAVAFSDDGVGVEDDSVMRAAFERARQVGAPLIQHCEYKKMSDGGIMHLGKVSQQLGFPGLDPRSEEAMIERDIDLCRQIGSHYHVAHISTAKAVELVRKAKAEGLPVTAEVCTHHLILTDEACKSASPNTKMHPPLRPKADVAACREGLLDGTIDCVVTDHAPHTEKEKGVGFPKAPPGIVGLETAISLAARAMIDTGLADWKKVVRWFTTAPNEILGTVDRGIEVGKTANLTMIDPQATWKVDKHTFLSKGRNTPFDGWDLVGKPVGTLRGVQLTLSLTRQGNHNKTVTR